MELNNLWSTLEGLFVQIGNQADQSDFCVCDGSLTIDGGGYLDCSDCTENLGKVIYLNLTRICMVGDACMLAATEVMAYSQIRQKNLSNKLIQGSLKSTICNKTNLFEGVIYTGDRSGDCMGLQMNINSLYQIIFPQIKTISSQQTYYTILVVNERFSGQDNTIINGGYDSLQPYGSIKYSVQEVVIQNSNFNTGNIVFNSSQSSFYLTSLHSLYDPCTVLNMTGLSINYLYYISTFGGNSPIVTYTNSLVQNNYFNSCPCNEQYIMTYGTQITYNITQFQPCFSNDSSSFTIDNNGNQYSYPGFGSLNCLFETTFSYCLSCGTDSNLNIYRNGIVLVNLDCSLIQLSINSTMLDSNYSPLIIKYGDPSVIISTYKFPKLIIISPQTTSVCQFQYNILERSCATCTDVPLAQGDLQIRQEGSFAYGNLQINFGQSTNPLLFYTSNRYITVKLQINDIINKVVATTISTGVINVQFTCNQVNLNSLDFQLDYNSSLLYQFNCWRSISNCSSQPTLSQYINNVWTQQINQTLIKLFLKQQITINFKSDNPLYSHTETYMLQCDNNISETFTVKFVGICINNTLTPSQTQQQNIYHVIGSTLYTTNSSYFSNIQYDHIGCKTSNCPNQFSSTVQMPTISSSIQNCTISYNIFQVDSVGSLIDVQDNFIYQFTQSNGQFTLNSTYMTDNSQVDQVYNYTVIAMDGEGNNSTINFSVILKSICYTLNLQVAFNSTNLNTYSMNNSQSQNFNKSIINSIYSGYQTQLPFYYNYSSSISLNTCNIQFWVQYSVDGNSYINDTSTQSMSKIIVNQNSFELDVFTPRYTSYKTIWIQVGGFVNPSNMQDADYISFILVYEIHLLDLCYLNNLSLKSTINPYQTIYLNMPSTTYNFELQQSITDCNITIKLLVNGTDCTVFTNCPLSAQVKYFDELNGTLVLQALSYTGVMPSYNQTISVKATSNASLSSVVQTFNLQISDLCFLVESINQIQGLPTVPTQFLMFDMYNFTFTRFTYSNKSIQEIPSAGGCPDTYTISHPLLYDQSPQASWINETSDFTYVEEKQQYGILHILINQVVNRNHSTVYQGDITIQGHLWDKFKTRVLFSTNPISIPVIILNPCLLPDSQISQELNSTIQFSSNKIENGVNKPPVFINFTVQTDSPSLLFGGLWNNPMYLCQERKINLYTSNYQVINQFSYVTLIPLTAQDYSIIIQTKNPKFYSQNFELFYVGDMQFNSISSNTQFYPFYVRINSCQVQQLQVPELKSINSFTVGNDKITIQIPQFIQTPLCGFNLNCNQIVSNMKTNKTINSVNWLQVLIDQNNQTNLFIQTNDEQDVGNYLIQQQCSTLETEMWPTVTNNLTTQISIFTGINSPPYFVSALIPPIFMLNQDWNWILPNIKDDQKNTFTVNFVFPTDLQIQQINSPNLMLKIPNTFVNPINNGNYTINITLANDRGANQSYTVTLQLQLDDQNTTQSAIKQQIKTETNINFPFAGVIIDYKDIEENGVQKSQAGITQISATGLVRISFIQPLLIPQTYNNTKRSLQEQKNIRLNEFGLDLNAIDVQVLNQGNPQNLNQKLKWDMTSMYNNILEVQLYFKDPLLVSSNLIPDSVSIKILKPYYFVSSIDKHVMINQTGQILNFEIPKQFSSLSQQKQAATIASMVSSASYGVVVGTCIGQFFLKGIIKKMWPLFLSLQLIILFCNTNQYYQPANLQMTIEQLQGILQLNALPKKQIIQQISPILSEQLLQTDSLLSNLSVLVILVFFFIVIFIMIAACYKCKQKMPIVVAKAYNKVYSIIFWNTIIKSYQCACLSLSFSAIRGFTNYFTKNQFKTNFNIVSSTFMVILVIFLPILCLYFLRIQSPLKLILRSTKQKFGALYQDTDESRKIAVYAFPIGLFARLFISMALCGYFSFGIQCMILIHIVFFELTYLILVKPYISILRTDTEQQRIYLFNQIVLFALAYLNLFFTVLGPQGQTQFDIGWIYTAVISLSISLNFAQILRTAVIPLLRKKHKEVQLKIKLKADLKRFQKRQNEMDQLKSLHKVVLELSEQKETNVQQKNIVKEELEKISELSEENLQNSSESKLISSRQEQIDSKQIFDDPQVEQAYLPPKQIPQNQEMQQILAELQNAMTNKIKLTHTVQKEEIFNNRQSGNGKASNSIEKQLQQETKQLPQITVPIFEQEETDFNVPKKPLDYKNLTEEIRKEFIETAKKKADLKGR